MQSEIQTANVRVLRRPVTGQLSPGRRVKAGWPAKLRTDGATLTCTVLDISSPGANLQVDNLPEHVTDIVLFLDPLVPIQASVAWRKKQRVGLKFQQEQSWVLEKYPPAFRSSCMGTQLRKSAATLTHSRIP